MQTVRKAVAPALVAAVAAPALTGCGLFGGSSRLEEALAYAPADATGVQFTDRAQFAERLGFADTTNESSESEVKDYFKAVTEAHTGTSLGQHYWQMRDEAAFTAFDLEWEALVSSDEGPATLWKMREDVDLEEVADELAEAGYDLSDDGDVLHLEIDLADTADTGYPRNLFWLAVLPDEHLIVSGNPDAGDAVVDTVLEDADSMADAGTFDDLVEGAPDHVEFASLRAEVACDGNAGRMSEAQRAPFAEERADLSTPEVVASYLAADEEALAATTVLGFEDDDTAEQDVEAREEFLAEGTNLATAEPFSEHAAYEVTRTGSQVLVAVEYDEPQRGYYVLRRGGDPVASCPWPEG